ncbi:AMP-binding protein [Nocardioides cynanchi]|uniref:AMP-binding protein n=1 Tax=Nocardioides cynanchi TaxID=2558918 RepID=UPI0017808345|nr:AMP-binding protein [Nocardioides cynanchi]
MGSEPVGIERRPRSLAHAFWDRVEVAPDAPAYYYPVDGGWQESTWGQTAELVEGLAAGLLALGVGVEDRVAIVSTTRFEWILSALAAWSVGAAVTSVSPGADDDRLAHVLADSGARVVIAEDDDEVRQLWRVRARIRDVAKVVQIDGSYPDQRVLSLDGLLRRGSEHLEEQPRATAQRRYAVRREGLAAIRYPDGSDPQSRGVRLRHSALTYQGAALTSLGVLGENDLLHLAVPLAQTFGQTLLAVQLSGGFPAAVDGDPERLLGSLAVVRPTFLGAPPEMLTRVRAAVSKEQSGRLQRRAMDHAYESARRVRELEAQGTAVPPRVSRRHRSLDRRQLAPVREAFGDRLRFVVAGTASLEAGLMEFFELAGVEVLGSYGVTEAGGAVCVDLPGDHRPGTAGRPLPGTSIRITDDGEVQVAGPGLMEGYHGRRLDTATVLRRGWLSTGDAGVLDEDGRLRILGRRAARFAD